MLPSSSGLPFEELGWSSFQDLAVAYVEDMLGVPATTFNPSRDRGLDGLIEPAVGGRALSDRIAIQAKHTSKFKHLTAHMLRGEIEKARRLHESESVSRYILITNLSLTVQADEEIRRAYLGVGIKHVEIHGRENLTRRIRESPRLRAMVPRLYGIGDLAEILDERRIAQSRSMLEAVRADLDKFVVTTSYRQGLEAVRNHGLLILLGDPAVGKSTIARCLCLAAADEYGSRSIVIEHIEQFATHWNPEGPPQIFWLDDAFGVTQFNDTSADTFNRTLPMIGAAVRSGTRLIITSRTYIWKAAKSQLKLGAIPQYNEAKVEIDVRRYSTFERGQILYNHLKLGDQPRDWKSRVKALLPAVARHEDFKPEAARRLGLTAFTDGLKPTTESLSCFVENPSEFLEETVAALDTSSQGALAALLMGGGELPIPLEKGSLVESVCDLYGITFAEIKKSLIALDNSFIKQHLEENGRRTWRFWHPTIGEALARVARDNAELLDVYLRGSVLERMIQEVACAGAKVPGAILHVGPERFSLLAERLRKSSLSPGALASFLAYRATDEFLKVYFDAPASVEHTLFNTYSLRNPARISLIFSLSRAELITDALRERFTDSIRTGITEDFDIDCVHWHAAEVVGAVQFQNYLEESYEIIRDEPDKAIEALGDIGDETDPDDHFYPLVAFAERLADFLPEDDWPELQTELSMYLNECGHQIREAREEALEEEERKKREEEEERFREAEEWYYDKHQRATTTSRPTFVAPAASEGTHDPYIKWSPARDELEGLFTDIDE